MAAVGTATRVRLRLLPLRSPQSTAAMPERGVQEGEELKDMPGGRLRRTKSPAEWGMAKLRAKV